MGSSSNNYDELFTPYILHQFIYAVERVREPRIVRAALLPYLSTSRREGNYIIDRVYFSVSARAC